MATMRKASFLPVVTAGTRVLVLGSLPGEESLARGQYYAHPQNQFWRLIGDVIGEPLAERDYDARLAVLNAAGVGLWDVVRSATRKGSLDADIRDHEPNALADLIANLPNLRAVAFNGGKAAQIGRRQIGASESLILIDLPSSSPARTLSFERKRIEWRRLRTFLRDDPAPDAEALLALWFAPETQVYWFNATSGFDAMLAERFGLTYELARAGRLEAWRETPRSALALVIALDQLPRNLFRDSAQAFATDAQARAIVAQTAERGFDNVLTPMQRKFLYMPYMHSESLADQDKGVRLFTNLGDKDTLDFMRRHRDLIARFGRFPHRNAILGRRSTPKEQAALAEGLRF
ncbi:MAG TPA: DNA-deoxyinosine glycosylase [Asticcacaulis sp.]|nr:DNA-deoxyinosine glycosylase [Asticcacaulis sp.]